MATLKNRVVFRLGRAAKAFLYSEAGLTRGEVPAGASFDNGGPVKADTSIPGLSEKPTKQQQQRIAQQEQRIEQMRQKLNERGETLRQVRQQLVNKNEELAELKAASSQPERLHEEVPIFFVVGASRSGTSWLMRALDFHPEILCQGEGRFFGRDFKVKGGEQRSTGKSGSGVPPSSLYNALAESEHLRLWMERSVWTREDDIEEHFNNLTRESIRYFLTQKLSKSGGKRIVGDKTPFTGRTVVREMGEIYPEARVIHIVRDGRDRVVSLMHILWERGLDRGGVYSLSSEEQDKRDRYRENPREFLGSGESIFTESRLRLTAEQWRAQVGIASQDGPTLLGENYTEVRYEDLLERSEEEFGRLLRFLGADSGEKAVARCLDLSSFEKRSGGRGRGEEDSSFPAARKGIAGDWKNVFTEEDKTVFKEVAGDLLVDLGYERDGNW